VPEAQRPMNDSPNIDPSLKEFIERVIIPILVKEYLAQSQKSEAQKVLMTEQRNCSCKPSGTQTEAKSGESSSKDLLNCNRGSGVPRDQRSYGKGVDTNGRSRM